MIRAAAPGDLAEMARIHALCFAKAWDEAALGDMLKSPGIVGLIAPGGFVLARVAADEAEVLTIAVDPTARRKGTGRALLAEAVSAVRARGARTMFLEVAHTNAAARALYELLGFHNVGRRKSYYEGGEDALILKTDLPLADLGHDR